MRAVVQRVSRAAVRVEEETVGRIDYGLIVFLGIHADDAEADAAYIVEKIAHLRIFDDPSTERMDRSALDVGAPILVVSQFTLYGDARKGRRPSYSQAAPPEKGERDYLDVCRRLRELGLTVETGRFRAEMEVEAVGHGPVTILLDSTRAF